VAQAHFEPGTHEKLYFITGATIATLLHETSYGLFDTLDIPIWGRLEDAADRLSAFLMVQFGEDIARSAFSGFTNYLIWTHVTPTDTDLQATLPPQMQRYYNVACILVVGNPVDVILSLMRCRRVSLRHPGLDGVGRSTSRSVKRSTCA
jgi:hypothetical protein